MVNDLFHKFANKTANLAGSPYAFLFASLIIIIWMVSGPFFHYSSNWQLVINTGTTIITFLMVFLLQNAQNRDGKATHVKLDELIKSVSKARNELIEAEDLTDEELDAYMKKFQKIAERKRNSRNNKK